MWMNGTILYKHTSSIGQVPTRNSKNSTEIYFVFFSLRDEEFVSKATNNSNIDLNKFPASNVRQLAKKMESSEATAKYIKQVASDPQVTQIHMMQHQCTELPPSKFQRKQKKSFKSRQATNKQHYHEDKQRERMPQVHRRFNNNHQAHTSQERYPSQRDTNQDRCN